MIKRAFSKAEGGLRLSLEDFKKIFTGESWLLRIAGLLDKQVRDWEEESKHVGGSKGNQVVYSSLIHGVMQQFVRGLPQKR